MTIFQLKLAVTAAESGSISAAAKVLGTCQPNASSSLKLLEEELGYPVFSRGSNGLLATDKGEAFLNYARQMLETNEKILNIKNEKEIYRLRLGTVSYYAAVEPFLSLCSIHRDEPVTDFGYKNISVSAGIQALIKRDLDLVAVPVMRHQLAGLIAECRKNRIEMTPVCHVPAVIMMRKDHPAALDGRCLKITQGCALMKDYPYIGLNNLAEDVSPTGYNDSDFIQCSYKMYAGDRTVRLSMLSATNGFAFGIKSPERVLSPYGLISFPVPGIILTLYVLTREGEQGRRENSEYLSLLKEEMETILK